MGFSAENSVSLNTDIAVHHLDLTVHRTNIVQALAQILDFITSVLSTLVHVELKHLTSLAIIKLCKLLAIVSQTSLFVDTNLDSLQLQIKLSM